MKIDPELVRRIKYYYAERFGVEVTAVQGGAEGVFRGSLIIATYIPKELERVDDVVFLDRNGEVKIFSTTQELIFFLEDRNRFNAFKAFMDARMFHAVVLLLVLFGVFYAGFIMQPSEFGTQALAILGSVVGLAAGLFFGAEKK